MIETCWPSKFYVYFALSKTLTLQWRILRKKVGELKSFYGFVNRFWAILGKSPPLHDWLHFGCLFYFVVNGIVFLYVFFKCSAFSFHPKSQRFRQIRYLLISEWDSLKCFSVKLKLYNTFYHMEHEEREKNEKNVSRRVRTGDLSRVRRTW